MEGQSEQKQIEKYLHQFCIEECMDEVLNAVLTERPANPYTAIAAAIELKTLPEILDIHFASVLHRDAFAVQAVLETNIGSFHGVGVYGLHPADEESEEAKDYTALEQALREIVITLDPRLLKQVDEAVAAVPHIEPAECMAVSIACAKAAAKFHGVKLHEYFADQVGLRRDEMAIPLPVITAAVREIGHLLGQQAVQIFPVKSSDLELSLDRLRMVVRYLSKTKRALPGRYDSSGTQCLEHTANIEEVVQALKEVFSEHDLHNDLKLGVRWNADKLLKVAEGGAFASTYVIENNAVKSGQDIVERLLVLWQDADIVSVDDVLSSKDTNALRFLKKRVSETVYDLKNANNTDKLKYCSKGIGGDAACHLQVITDSSLLDHSADLEKHLVELPYNAIRISWSRLHSISQAVEHVKRIRKMNLAVVVNSGDAGSTSIDDIDVDFAVGVAASQYHTGGIHALEVSSKLNRLADLKRTNESIPFVGGHFRSQG